MSTEILNIVWLNHERNIYNCALKEYPLSQLKQRIAGLDILLLVLVFLNIPSCLYFNPITLEMLTARPKQQAPFDIPELLECLHQGYPIPGIEGRCPTCFLTILLLKLLLG